MAAGTLKKLIGNTAFGYWVKNGWLHNAGERASLTGAGALKVANRLAGRDGGYSVGHDAVLQMADIIRRGARSPFAGGEALESIPGPDSAAPAPPQVAAQSDIRSSATARPPSPASETAGPIKRARPGSKADPSSSLSPAPTPQPQPPDSGPACAPRQGAPPFRRSSAGPLYRQLEDLGRVRLSENFYMRDFLYSEIAYAEGIPNLPENPELAIEAGKQLCERVLEPLQAGVGRLAIRSAYRSPAVNAKGAENNNQYSCAGNERNRAAHIWDQRDEHGRMGATACVVVPAFQSCYERRRLDGAGLVDPRPRSGIPQPVFLSETGGIQHSLAGGCAVAGLDQDPCQEPEHGRQGRARRSRCSDLERLGPRGVLAPGFRLH